MKKKHIKVLGFIIIGFLIHFPIEIVKAKPPDDRFYASEYLYGTYIKKNDGNQIRYETARVLKRSDGQFAYCIQPFLEFVEGNLKTSYDDNYASVNHVTQEQWDRISLLAYYGYQYENHTDSKWYIITQMMIWKTVDPTSDIYFTDVLDGNRISLYEAEIKKLDKLVEEHYKVPNFVHRQEPFMLHETRLWGDENYVLSKYKVTNTSKVTTRTNGNNIYITANQFGKGMIEFTKASTKYKSGPVIYSDGTSQSLLVPGNYNPIQVQVDIDIVAGRLQITKVDSETNLPSPQGQASLKGATYNIHNLKDEYITTITIGNDGTGISGYIPYGSYYVYETKSGIGYYRNKQAYHFKINSTDTVNIVTPEDVIKGRIQVTKVDKETNQCVSQGGANLKGAQYGVYDYNNSLVDTIVIQEDCIGISKELPYGNYTVKEVTSSLGYQLDPKDYPINIISSDTISITSKEEIIKGKIQIKKVDKDTNQCKAQGEASLSGAEYGVYNHNDTLVDTIVIQEDCIGISKELPYGNYIVKEVASSLGYQLDPEDYLINITSNDIISVTLKEEITKGKIQIKKVDKDTNQCKAQGEASLIGAKYGIYDSNHLLVDILVIQHNCKAISKELVYGTYTIQELESSLGYLINPKIIPIKIEQKQVYPVTTTEEVLKNKIEIYKFYEKEDMNTIVQESEAVFELYNIDNEFILSIQTDENGYAEFELPYGSYTIKQIYGNIYYQLISPFVIKVNEQTPLQQTYYLKDDSIQAKLKITKVDSETKQPILHSKAIFQIRNKQTGKLICQNVNQTICEYETNDEGILITPFPLISGNYIIEEIKAPEGYISTNQKMEFSVDRNSIIINDSNDGNCIEVIFENQIKKGSLELTKIDYITKEPLPNTEIAVYNENGLLLYQGLTNQLGKLVLNHIEYGTYYVEEIKAPQNYVLNPKKIYFKIMENNELIKITMENQKVEITDESFSNPEIKDITNLIKVPDTSIFEISLLSTLGWILVIMGIVIWKYHA